MNKFSKFKFSYCSVTNNVLRCSVDLDPFVDPDGAPDHPALFKNDGPILDRATSIFFTAQEMVKYFLPYKTTEGKSTSLFLEAVEKAQKETSDKLYKKIKVTFSDNACYADDPFPDDSNLYNYTFPGFNERDHSYFCDYAFGVVGLSTFQYFFYKNDSLLKELYKEVEEFSVETKICHFSRQESYNYPYQVYSTKVSFENIERLYLLNKNEVEMK